MTEERKKLVITKDDVVKAAEKLAKPRATPRKEPVPSYKPAEPLLTDDEKAPMPGGINPPPKDEKDEPTAKPVKLPKIGDEVTVVKLTNLYDKYAPDVLRSLLESAAKKRGAPRRWTVRGDLPQPAQYRGMKQTMYTRTVEALVDDAFNDLESVTEEVRSWYDALPEGLQAADRGSRLDEAANSLENLQRPDVPDGISNVTAVYYPGLGVESRADRVREAASMLQTARDAIDTDGDEARIDCADCEGTGKKDCEHCGTTDAMDCDECEGSGKVEVEGLDDFVSELESVIGEAEGVEIPGMYD